MPAERVVDRCRERNEHHVPHLGGRVAEHAREHDDRRDRGSSARPGPATGSRRRAGRTVPPRPTPSSATSNRAERLEAGEVRDEVCASHRRPSPREQAARHDHAARVHAARAGGPGILDLDAEGHGDAADDDDPDAEQEEQRHRVRQRLPSHSTPARNSPNQPRRGGRVMRQRIAVRPRSGGCGAAFGIHAGRPCRAGRSRRGGVRPRRAAACGRRPAVPSRSRRRARGG